LFNGQTCFKLETDRYHKWERNNPNYNEFTHLNPYANYLEKMNNDIYNLKIGHEIYTVDYDHSCGKFTKEEKISSSKNIILCGLHTLYNKKMNELLDLKIFMDTDRELIKKWKIKRDVEERGNSLETIVKQIEKREKDFDKYIFIQKKNADIIIKFYEENKIIQCIFTLVNKKYFEKIIKNYNGNFIINNDELIIKISEKHYENLLDLIKIII
jgi:uridine kinase